MILHRNKGIALILVLTLVLGLAVTLTALANTGQVSGLAFLDGNSNGLMDANEKALAGVEVSLVAVDGSSERLLAQTTADAQGQYQFTGLQAGSYYLQAVLPKGHYFSEPQEGGNVMLPGRGQESKSPVFSLNEGEQKQQYIGAHKRSAYINLIAFSDQNMNGGRMTSEPPIRDVQVQLLYEYNGETHVVSEGLTNKDGELQLRDLSPATYRVGVVMPEPFIIGPMGQKLNTFYNVIPPTENNKGVSEPFNLDRSIGLGVGGVKAGTLKGRIWFDRNMNGALDADEGGFAGILITLTHLDMGVTRTLTTTQEADFVFEHLQAGEYGIQADLPEGVMFAQAGSPSVFTDGYSASQSMKLNIREDGATLMDPIGVMPASSVLITAFLDSNVNGLLDEGEPAFAGARVEAMAEGQSKASATTDAKGRAVLPRVPHGEAVIQVSLPDGQIFSIQGGPEGNRFSSQAAASTLSLTVPVSAGEQVSLYAGTTLPSAISGVLFDDSNLSGIRDGNEAGISGFTVQAVNASGEVVAETTTSQDGAYTLSNLVPASYQVRFLLVSPYVFSALSETGAGTENQVAEQVVAYGQTRAIPLSPGMTAENVDAGAFRSAIIKGSILLGDEQVGFEGNSGGLAGVRIDLLDENGSPVSEHTNAISDDQGQFSLKGALPGVYKLVFHLPEDAKFSKPLVDEKQIISEAIEVKASDELTISPLFAVKTGTVSGTAFVDVNNNGALDEGDLPLAEALVNLTNKASGEVYEAASDLDGRYHLPMIRPGDYAVKVNLPEGYAIDQHADSPVPASLEGQSTADATFEMGSRLENQLLPAVRPISLSVTAFYDNDLDGVYTQGTDSPHTLQASLTHLRTGTLISLSTDASGSYHSPKAFPGEYQLVVSLPELHLLQAPRDATQQLNTWSKTITLSEADNELRLALVQLGSLSGTVWNMDGSNSKVSGLTVKLFDEQGSLLQETLTDAKGRYQFEKLLPIAYRIETELAEGYRFARSVDTQVLVSIILSDKVGTDQSKGRSDPVKLNMGENKAHQDIGMGAMGKLGDFAWLDLDQDGMQDGGEPGIPGLVIKLYQYGQFSAETTTDEYGRYSFDSLFPGSYSLEVTMPEEIKPTLHQTQFPLVASILEQTDGNIAKAEGVIVPSGGRNLNADLGFVLKQDGRLPASMQNLPEKDWTPSNNQSPKR